MPLSPCLAALGQPGNGSSAVYRHHKSANGFPSLGVETLYELFAKSAEKYPQRPALGRRVMKVRPGRRSRAPRGSGGVRKAFDRCKNSQALHLHGLRALWRPQRHT
jgi:hypothetical protein